MKKDATIHVLPSFMAMWRLLFAQTAMLVANFAPDPVLPSALHALRLHFWLMGHVTALVLQELTAQHANNVIPPVSTAQAHQNQTVHLVENKKCFI